MLFKYSDLASPSRIFSWCVKFGLKWQWWWECSYNGGLSQSVIDQARLLPVASCPLPLVAREEIWKTGPADAFAASPPSQLNDKGDDQEKLSKLRLFKKTMQGKRKFYLVSRLEEHKLSRWPSYSFKLQIFFSLSYFKTLLCSLFRNYIFVRTEIFANIPKLLRVELMRGKY